ncbi:MAG: hypothetical protein AAFY56_10815 [Pseudomonadota bacterium]
MSKLSHARQRAAQQRASRVNGAKSKGPVTEEGRARSSRNAVSHGVLSSSVTLSADEIQLAEGIRYGYVRRYTPQDQLECEIVESLVMCQIKLRRLDRLELEAMERVFMLDDMNEPANPCVDELEKQKKYPSLATLGRYRGRLNHERKLAEQRLMALIHDRPRAGEPMGLGALQHRFMADMIEEAEREQARLLAEQGIDAPPANGNTHQGAGWDVIPGPETPAVADDSPRDTNEPGGPLAASFDALTEELMAQLDGITDPTPAQISQAIAALSRAA